MRNPSIHITLSDFENILEDLDIQDFPVKEFFSKARKYSVDTRVINVTNHKTTKQVNQITLASHGDANLVAEIIYAVRIKLKHRGVRKINEANVREWSLCKKLADICNTFCEDFQLATRSGFITYIEIGIKRLKDSKNLLQRLVSMYENITAQYEAELEIREYQSSGNIKQEVTDINNFYVKYIAQYTGIYEDYTSTPESYIHLCRLHKLVSSKGWDYKEYIISQFEALSFCNGIPTLESMYSEKGIERFNKYKFKNKPKPSEESETPIVEGSLWSKINKHEKE